MDERIFSIPLDTKDPKDIELMEQILREKYEKSQKEKNLVSSEEHTA